MIGQHNFDNLSLPFLDANPHSVFRSARAVTPFIRRADGAYLVLRASDIEMLFSDTRTRQVEDDFLRLRGVTDGALFDLFTSSMLFANDQAHRDRRSPLSRNFAFRLMQELRPVVRRIATTILRTRSSSGPLRVKDDFASPLPAMVIADILGIGGGDVDHFTGIVYRVARGLSQTWDIEELADINDAARQLCDYVRDLVRERRKSPKDDFISAYIDAVAASGTLSAFEEVAQLAIIILGGSDTTRAAMVILVSLLLQHREQLKELRQNTDLIPASVLEALRFEPSVASVTRVVLEDVALDGKRLPAGSIAVFSLLSALRDPERHSDPDDFSIHRPQQRWHAGFGAGAHRCIGEMLAKVELEEGLASLLGAYGSISPASRFPSVHGHAGIRLVDEFEVEAS